MKSVEPGLPSTAVALSVLCAILVAPSAVAQHAIAKIDSVAKTATIPCPEMGYFNNSTIDASVRFDSAAKKYFYSYSVHTTKPQPRSIGAIFFRDLAPSEVSSTFTGFSFCQFSKGGIGCINDTSVGDIAGLIVVSDSGPGIVRYEIESRSSPLFTDDLLKNLLPYFHGDQDALYEVVQETAGEQCSSGRIKAMSERRVTGVTIGPSERLTDNLQLRATIDQSGRASVAVLNKDRHAPSDNIRGLSAFDSEGKRIALSTLEDASGLNPSAQTTAMTGKSAIPLRCNIKGVYVDGVRADGNRVRVGASVSTPDCSLNSESFDISLPK